MNYTDLGLPLLLKPAKAFEGFPFL